MSVSREDSYIIARCSLHVWPMKDGSYDALAEFSRHFLQLTQDEFRVLGVSRIKSCGNPQNGIKDEYVVEFDSIGERDSFRSYAPRLKPFKRVEAGIRLALPDFLMPSFKVLENEGYHIAQRRPGTKRSIKFQDSTRSLVLDIKLPSSSWVRITPEDVLNAVSGRRRERIPAVAEILQIGGEPLAPVQAPLVAPPVASVQGPQTQLVDDFDADMSGDDIAADQF